MRAEPFPFPFIEGAFEQGPENRRLDRRPIFLGRVDQNFELIGIKRDRLRVFEEAAVEAQDVVAEFGRKSALVHVGPKAVHHRREGVRSTA